MTERTAAAPLPLGTLAFVVAALVVEGVPDLASDLGFERRDIARGEVWRLLTGHLVHGLPQLALADLLPLALVGAWVERTSRALWVATVSSSACLSSLAVLAWTEHERYVGSSALVSGLLVAGAVSILRHGSGRGGRVLATFALVLLAGKLGLELFGAWPAALGDLPPGHETATVAHVVGGLAGGTCALFLPRARTSS